MFFDKICSLKIEKKSLHKFVKGIHVESSGKHTEPVEQSNDEQLFST